MKKKTYKINFPIGDWSRDGHGICEYYLIQSNKPVEEIREVHFRAPHILGFDIGELCRDYEDGAIRADIAKILIDKKIVTKEKLMSSWGEEVAEDEDIEIDPDILVEIWINCLMHIDADLKLKIIENENPSINFYGHDKKGRHLRTPGYGLFST